MSDINWKDGAVCFSGGEQWQVSMDDRLQGDVFHACCSDLSVLLGGVKFQLNEIRIGDFIPASELDTEQKYNEVVEVFGLFGFGVPRNKNYFSLKGCEVFKTFCDFVVPDALLTTGCKRQLTYSQIIAIGKLKRMMLERERSKGGYVNEVPDNTSEFDAVVSGKSVGVSDKNHGASVVMTNKTAAIKVLEALGMDASLVQSVSINGKEIFNMENADNITTVTVSKYIKKT